MTRWDADAHIWSGLLAGDNYAWQHGLRVVCRGIGDVQFQSSMSGYDGWEEVAESAIKRKPKALFLGGHSNGGYATTKCAEAVKPFGIKVWILSFDRTLKPCPPAGSNVVEILDIWAGLQRIDLGPDFRGHYRFEPFPEESHIGIINNERAQKLAIAFGKRWKASL